MNQSNLKKWLALSVGATLALSDTASLLARKATSGKLAPMDYTVERVAALHDSQGIADWVFVYLVNGVDPSDKLVLTVQIVDNEEDFFVYVPSTLPVKNRAENVNDGNLWLFDEPSDPNDFKVIELSYTASITETTDKGKEIVHFQKQMGERSGKYNECPKRSGLNNLLATYVPYSSKDNEQAAILEIGAADSDDGGAITFFSGRQILSSEVTVYQHGKTA